MSLWQWGVVVFVTATIGQWVVRIWMSTTLGVRASPARLARAKEFMRGSIYVDQLITSGEIGQAMLALDEQLQRPEIAEIPALAAQVNLARARVATLLQRYDTALEAGAHAVEFYRQAYRRLRTASNASNLGEALQTVAKIHIQREDTPRAIKAYEEIRALNRRAAFRQTVVRTDIELAKLHLQIDDHHQAITHAEEGYQKARKWGMTEHAIEALDTQALATALAGNQVESYRLLDVAASLMRADTSMSVRAHHLMIRTAIAVDEGDLRTQVAAGGELLSIAAAIKARRGWRQDQSETVNQLVALEKHTLEAAYTLAERGDEWAASVYVSALGALRRSEIAHHLRDDVLVTDTEARAGLPAVITDFFEQLAQVEDPKTANSGSAAALYERLETAVSARFRQLVQAQEPHAERVVPGYHYVQIRLIEESHGSYALYGSWEPPGQPAVLFGDSLPADLVDSLLAVTGAVDRRRPRAAGQRSSNVRASATGWAESRQYRALSGQDDRWRSATSSLLPPELLDLLRDVPPNADDNAIPLIVLSPDSLLWTLPWSALTIDDSGILLGDRAATALLPSPSLLRPKSTARRAGSRVLSYLHGVHSAGLSLERSALTEAWPGQIDEMADAGALVGALADMSAYAMLTMSVHGDNRPGLAHSLLLDPQRRTRLSAARMMSMTFPDTVVVGACFSGALDERFGTDPIGIPSVMLCRGASTVVGGIFPLPDGPATGHATASILGNFYTLKARGAQTPWALRRAQQRWRAEHETAPYSWAGLTTLSNCDLDQV